MYSRLAPYSLEELRKLTIEAVIFFSPHHYAQSLKILNRENMGSIQPLSMQDFSDYLEIKGILTEADKEIFRLEDLGHHLERTGLLRYMGQGENPVLSRRYYFFRELTSIERKGFAWLSPFLGAEYIHNYFSPGIVQITGSLQNGDVHAGTGLIVGPGLVLTCAHVVKEMVIDYSQNFNGISVEVTDCFFDEIVDVGIIKINANITPVLGLSFRPPTICERVFTLGYPRIPLSTKSELVMQSGETTSCYQKLLHGQEVFLFSAIARPGNSGGPIISEKGHIVGIVSQQLEEDAATSKSMPFFAGVGAEILCRTIERLVPSFRPPFEDYS